MLASADMFGLSNVLSWCVAIREDEAAGVVTVLFRAVSWGPVGFDCLLGTGGCVEPLKGGVTALQ